MSSSEPALSALREAVALWQVGHVGADAVIYAACDLLVAGVDEPSLRMLAGVSVRSTREDSDEVAQLLKAVMPALGLPYCPRGFVAADESSLRAMAARLLAGEIEPRYLASWACSYFGYDTTSALAQRLVALDDIYCEVAYMDRTVDDIDAEVFAEARRITSLP